MSIIFIPPYWHLYSLFWKFIIIRNKRWNTAEPFMPASTRFPGTKPPLGRRFVRWYGWQLLKRRRPDQLVFVYPPYDQGFPRAKSLKLTNMRMTLYTRFGAKNSSIKIGVKLQTYRRYRGKQPATPRRRRLRGTTVSGSTGMAHALDHMGWSGGHCYCQCQCDFCHLDQQPSTSPANVMTLYARIFRRLSNKPPFCRLSNDTQS